MQNWKWNILFCGLALTFHPALASINPSNLVKVTPEVNPKCVEFYSYQNQMYCSTKQLQSQSIDPNIKDYETQVIVFDQRPWQAVWGKKDDIATTVEYVPMGDDINNWHELITSQFFPGIHKKVSPKEFAASIVDGIKKSGFKPVVSYIKETPDTVIFEFRILSPKNQIQDEVQIITKGKNGLYVLHYVIKEADMGQANRDAWIKNFSMSHIK